MKLLLELLCQQHHLYGIIPWARLPAIAILPLMARIIKTAGDEPSLAAQILETPADFRQEKFMIENWKDLTVPKKVASFVDKNIVVALKDILRCRNKDGNVDTSLVERASNFITSEFDSLLNVELYSKLPELSSQLGAEDIVPLKYNAFVRALTGEDRFYIDVFEIIRASDSFKAIEQDDVKLTRFETNEALAKLAVRFIRKVGGFSANTGFKLVLLGHSAAGKSALVHRFVKGSFNDTLKTTMGLDHHTKLFSDGDQVRKVLIWDTAGQERFADLTQSYCRGALGAFIVYDTTRPNDVTKYITLAKQHNIHDIVVFGNKIDLLPDFRCINGMRRSDGIVCFAGSAKTGSMVNEAFERLIQMALDRHYQEKDPSAAQNATGKGTIAVTSDQKLPGVSSCCG